jgi:hypothetical protein
MTVLLPIFQAQQIVITFLRTIVQNIKEYDAPSELKTAHFMEGLGR